MGLDPALAMQLRACVRRAARSEILPRFRALGAGQIATKSGPADLVTAADHAAEAAILADVAALWPAAFATGEERVAADPALRSALAEAETAVVLDPVDGTWNYAKGLALFGVILAVLRRGRPIHALLYDPLLDDWIEAEEGGPARYGSAAGASRLLATSAEHRPGRLTGYASCGLFPRETRVRLAADLAEFSRVTSLRCAVHEYRMLAQGHVDFCLSGPVPHPWDHAAGVLAVERAGGVARFLDGEAYHAGRLRGVVLAAGSPALWEMLAARLSYLA